MNEYFEFNDIPIDLFLRLFGVLEELIESKSNDTGQKISHGSHKLL
jgi:hypothetical protein